MCRPDSSSDQRPKVGLPSHSTPQPLLEASVMTTFLLCAVSKITPCFSQRRSLQRARADTQAQVNVTRWRMKTFCFSQKWMGRMRSRLKYWQSHCHKAQHFLESFEQTCGPYLDGSRWRLIVVARSAETVAESITVPRNETRWLGDSMLLAKLTLSPKQHKWPRRRVLCDVETASDWERMSQSSR